MSKVPACCRTRVIGFPSGPSRVHTKDCRRYRDGAKVGREAIGDLKIATRTPAEHLAAWLTHPEACVCESCRYTEAHLDDEDDARAPADVIDLEAWGKR